MGKSRFLVFLFLFYSLARAEPFTFIAYGDMPYTVPTDYVRYERLIKAINQTKSSFTIFVGDTKSGSTPCSDEYNEIVKDYFNQFHMPLVYSIGDNEWTDCHRPLAGSYDPIERLAKLRNKFFSTENSFGKKTLTLHRQADLMPEFSLYVENSYWIKNGFLFVSLHIPGSNNNFGRTEESTKEYQQRNTANLAWIDYAFTLAKKQGLAGIIFAYQADMFYSPSQATELTSGFRETLSNFTTHAQAFKKPVLLINGDSHRLKIDQPLQTLDKKFVLENVIRLQVMGEDEVQAVEITVEPSSEQPFSFKPLILKANSQYLQ
jgi:hypothetical protein